MWFIGLVVGGFLGGAIGSILRWDEAWLLFAALGAVAGVVYREKNKTSVTPALEARVAALERELRDLKQRGYAAADLRPVETAPQPEPVASPAAQPVSPTVEPTPVVIEPPPRPLMPEPKPPAAPRPPAEPN